MKRILTGILALLCLLTISLAQNGTHGVTSWGWLGMDQSACSPAPFVQVSTNGAVTAAVRGDGTVVCWGDNENGQCSVPPGLSGVIQVSVGGSHVMALKSNGTIVCWGSNSYGQATVPAGLGGVVQVAAGGTHSVALKSNGQVVCWGDNTNYQLDGAPTGSNVVEISAGQNHSVALLSNGTAYAWGDDWETGAINVPVGLTNVIGVSATGNCGLALLADGTMQEWGNDQNPITPALTGIVQVAGYYALESNGTVVNWNTGVAVAGLSKIVQIASAEAYGAGTVPGYLVALNSSGTLYCLGDDSHGQSDPPLNLDGIIKVSSGYRNLALLTSGGTVICKGDNTYGQSTVPAGLASVIDVQTNGAFVDTSNGLGFGYIAAHTVALKSNGTVVCWGLNTGGECTVPGDLAPVQDIASGADHSIALTTTGKVVCWGGNYYGQCNVPAGLKDVIHVAAGMYYSAALESTGQVVCWGYNSYGACTVPTNAAGAVQVSAGGEVSVARTAGGVVTCWGGLLLGVSDFEEGDVPAGFTGASDVSAGYQQCSGLAAVDLNFASSYATAGTSVDLNVFMPTPPGAAGATLTFASNDPSVSVPVSLHVGEGVRTSTVVVSVDSTAVDGIATITAHMAGGTYYATLHTLPKETALSTLSFRSGTIVGGQTTIATVKLGSPTGPTGGTFTVVSGTPTEAVAAISTIQAPAGLESLSFPVTSSGVAVTSGVKFSVYKSGVLEASATLVLLPPATLSFTEPSVHGGLVADCIVKLPAPAPAGGQAITLSSSSTLVTPPAPITIAAGTSSLEVPLKTAGVDSSTNVTISVVTSNGRNPSAVLSLTPATISSVIVAPTTLIGQNTGKITVNLLGDAGPSGIKVSLTETNADGNVPALMTVPSTKSSLTSQFSPKTVTSATPVTVHATVGSVSEQASFTINPAPNKPTSISISPVSNPGGYPATALVKFSGPSAPTGLTILFKTTPAGLLNLPSSVTSAASSTSLSVPFVPNGVVADTEVTIEASAGSTTVETTYKLKATTLANFQIFTPSQFLTTSYTTQGGTPLQAVLSPNAEPPAAGFTVKMTSSDAHVIVPETTVISLTSSPVVNITTKSVTASTPVTLTASSGSVSFTVNLTLTVNAQNPATLEGMDIEWYAESLVGGNDAYLYLYPYGATTNGFTVTLTSSDPKVFPVPPTVTIGQADAPTTLTVATTTVSKATPVTITAKAGSVTITQTVTVQP